MFLYTLNKSMLVFIYSDGDDFNFQSVMLQVTTSSTRVCRTIDIIIDTENEPPKTLRIYLNTDDPELVLFTERVSNVTIVDSIGETNNVFLYP